MVSSLRVFLGITLLIYHIVVPSKEEIDFVLEILDKIASPSLDRIDTLLDTAGKWDSVKRNDFCRSVNDLISLLIHLE